MTEDSLQAQIVKWFTNSYCLKTHQPRSIIFSIPNGGFRHKIEAMKLKATGMLSGVSDLIVIHKGIVYFCELKTDSGRLSQAQVDFNLRLNENGQIQKTFRSLLEFQEFIVSL